MPEEKKAPKTWSERLKFLLQCVLLIAAGISIAQNWNAARDYDRLKDELDAQGAYRTLGLQKAVGTAQFVAQKSQDALKLERAQNQKILEHCKNHPCGLPPDLAVMLPEQSFQQLEPVENLLLKEQPKE